MNAPYVSCTRLEEQPLDGLFSIASFGKEASKNAGFA